MRGGVIIEREMLAFPFYVCGRMWPLFREIVWACFGRFIVYRDWPLGASNPYRFMRLYIYMMSILFRIFLSRFEVNMSCRLIFNSVETFNMSVRS